MLLSDVGVYGEFRIFVLAKKHFLSRSLSLSSGVSLPDSFPVFRPGPLSLRLFLWCFLGLPSPLGLGPLGAYFTQHFDVRKVRFLLPWNCVHLCPSVKKREVLCYV